MQKDIESNCLSIKELLKKHTNIRIPYFQRQYVWKFKDQIKTLINDLCDDMSLNKESYYFLGTMIVKHDSKYTLIIDGQQRITTIFLLIIALYKNKSLSEENKRIIEELLEVFNFDLFNIKNKNLFKNLINSGLRNKVNLDDETLQSNYYLNLQEIEKYFNSQFNEDKVNDFFIKLINFAIVTKIEINNNLNENVVFSKINSTGQELSAYDMLKNDLISSLSFEYKNDKDIDEKIENWNNSLDELNSYLNKDSSLLLRHFIAYKTFNIPNKENKKIFNAYLELKENKYQNNLENLLNEYLEFARYYKYFYQNEFDKDFSNNELLIITKRFNTYIVLLIYIIKNYSKINEFNKIEIIDKDNLKIGIKILEYYIISREFGERNEKEITRAIPKILGDIKRSKFKNLDFISNVYNNLIYMPKNNDKVLKYSIPDEAAIKNGFMSTKIYEKSNDFTKLFLIRVLTYKRKINYVFSNITVEHILPQKFDANWNVDENEAEAYKHTIGNLTLTAKEYNSSYSNKSFIDKKKEMDKDEYWFNRSIMEKENWTINDIRERSNMLYKKFKEIWNFENIIVDESLNKNEESMAIDFDLLQQRLDKIIKHETYFRKLNIDNNVIKNILIKYFFEDYTYQEIEELLFKVNYKGWIPCAIFDFLEIHKPLDLDIFKWINDNDSKINELTNILKDVNQYNEKFKEILI